MRDEALLLIGVYEDVLTEITKIQDHLPEHIMFLQPYSSGRIVKLDKHRPSTEDPVRLYLTTTTDLNSVQFTGEIVGWDDKRRIEERRKQAINRLIWTLQPNECGLYEKIGEKNRPCVNLLHVRRVKRLARPFSVTKLRKFDSNARLKGTRETSGGWVYVHRADELI